MTTLDPPFFDSVAWDEGTTRPLAESERRDRRLRLAGRAVSGLVVLLFVLDAGMKLPPIQPVIETMAEIGWPADPGTARTLAAILLVATGLYAWPRTALLGAILLTGYLGGAVATHLRIGSPLPSHTLFGVYLGLLVWGGLWLRDPRLRALLPIRT